MSFAAAIERLQKLENPYPGLRPFETAESHLFFGRDQQVAELINRLERHRFLAVVGVSGSGKSSLVRAGLIPALDRGRILGTDERWRTVVTRPGGAPFDSLGADLARSGLDGSRLRESSYGLIEVARLLPREETLLVIVDQFEELFRYKDVQPVTEAARRRHAATAADAAEYVQLLLAASRGHPPVYIVLTMRSDYLGDCAEFRDLPETLNDCQYLVPRLTREQRKEAIERPLGRVEMAPSLVQRLLNDAGDEPDQLPVLQHALMRTWQHWRNSDPERTRRIELKDYEAVGGFGGALNQHADELLAGVPQEIAAIIFKRLTARGRGNRERRDPAQLATLWAVCGAVSAEQQARVTAVIDHFRRGDATFLSPLTGALDAQTYIDITHESLIRQWKKLRDEWLREEQLSAKTFLEVVDRARNWKDERGELLAGLDLRSVIEWDRRRNRTAAWAEHYADEEALRTVNEFLAASRKAQRSRIFWRRARWAAVVLLVLGTAGMTLNGWRAGVEAARARAELESRTAEQARALAEEAKEQAESELASVSRENDPKGAPDSPDSPTPAHLRAPAATPRPPVTPVPIPAQSTARVYIQVRSKEDADAVRPVLSRLFQQAGFVVPKPEILAVGPRSPEVRFFRKSEQQEAEQIVRILTQAMIGGAVTNYVEGHEDSQRIRDRHFEVWLPAQWPLAGVVRQLNEASVDIRKAAGAQLARAQAANPAAIGLVLETLSEQNLPSLSTEGRINALYFLNRSDAAAWNDDYRKRARSAIARIRAGGNAGAPGPQTARELDDLEKKVGR